MKTIFLFFLPLILLAEVKRPDLSLKNLTALKKSTQLKSVRAAFKEVPIRKKDCPHCGEYFIGANKYESLLSKSFLAVDKYPNDFGGFFVTIIFEDNPQFYGIWVYDVGDAEMQVRDIEPMNRIADGPLMIELKKKIYATFWM